MNKIIYALFMLGLLLAGPVNASGKKRVVVESKPAPVSSSSSSSQDAVDTPGHVGFGPATKYTAAEKEVLAVSESLANELLKSKCFEDGFLSTALIDTKGQTNEFILNKLQTTNLTVPVTMYYQNNNVVGYRNTGSSLVHTNRKFHAGATACSRGSNLLHEWSHVVGYSHTVKATKQRPRSIPYRVGALFNQCCTCVKNSILNCKIAP